MKSLSNILKEFMIGEIEIPKKYAIKILSFYDRHANKNNFNNLKQLIISLSSGSETTKNLAEKALSEMDVVKKYLKSVEELKNFDEVYSIIDNAIKGNKNETDSIANRETWKEVKKV